jgi:hypothetical protein
MDIRPITAATPGPPRGVRIVSGTVSTQQPAPAAFTDPLYVVLDNTLTPTMFARWPQSHGASLPVAGDTVIVGYTQDNVEHVLGWNI